MPGRELPATVPMRRVAIVALDDRFRDALVTVAGRGDVELECGDEVPAQLAEAVNALVAPPATPAGGTPGRALQRQRPDVDALVERGRRDLLEGELELARRAAMAGHGHGVAAAAGWTPAATLPSLTADLARCEAVAVELPRPPFADPPVLFRGGAAHEQLGSLVSAYGQVRYGDIDPTYFAAGAFVLMFGMMFADAGHGALLVMLGVLALLWRDAPLHAHRVWLLLVTAGISATAFGLLGGEVFGPTHLVTPPWGGPLEEPIRLLVVALAVGAALLALSYAIGIVNRGREGGVLYSLTHPAGGGGALLFLGCAVAGWGMVAAQTVIVTTGALLTVLSILLIGWGLRHGDETGGSAAEVVVGLFDTVLRLGSNVISFVRLGAFGLVHAALGDLVWSGTAGLWGRGWEADIAAVLTFVIGNAVAFVFEGFVVTVQALRLEYYELFSRVFAGQGRPFTPWRMPVIDEEAPS